METVDRHSAPQPMLEGKELKRRIEAARILRGMSQAKLEELFAADGLGKYDAGRIERGEMTMQRVHRDAFVRHLGVPDYWFSEPDVDRIVQPAEAPPVATDPAVLRPIVGALLPEVVRGVLEQTQGKAATPGRSPASDRRPLAGADGGA